MRASNGRLSNRQRPEGREVPDTMRVSRLAATEASVVLQPAGLHFRRWSGNLRRRRHREIPTC